MDWIMKLAIGLLVVGVAIALAGAALGVWRSRQAPPSPHVVVSGRQTLVVNRLSIVSDLPDGVSLGVYLPADRVNHGLAIEGTVRFIQTPEHAPRN